MAAIEFKKNTLGAILKAKNGLRVPLNQREYSWKKEHVQDLFTDLNGAITSADTEYFLGTIVAVSKAEKDTVTEVFDGQQRLATTMILIAAIRDRFHKSGDKDTAEEITRESLYSKSRKTLELETHFGLSGVDNEFFTNYVLCEPEHALRKSAKPDKHKESHQRIKDAADAAAEHISTITANLPKNSQSELLHKWLDFIAQGARVIWVEVADQPTAFRIFETMNDRGLKLSAADLIKNYLYSLAEKNQDHVVQKWQSMVGTLESLGPDSGDIVDFIRYFWITTHGHTRTNVLFDGIKKEIKKEPVAITWSTHLESRANDYAALYTSTHPAWRVYHPETRAKVETLRFLGVSQIRPLLLAAFGKFSQKEMEKLLIAAVNWSVRVLLAGVPSGTLEGQYSKNAKRITDGEIKTVDKLATELSTIIPDDNKFVATFKTASVADAQFARYYLRVLQMQADGKMDNQYVPNDGKLVTLEHILPKNPGQDWKHISPEDQRTYRNRLGNLALLDEGNNSTLGNVGYSVKEKVLANSHFSLTTMAVGQKPWGTAEIQKRQDGLANYAIRAWPIK